MVKHLARAANGLVRRVPRRPTGIAWAQESDTTPPTLVSLSLVPDTVDVSAAARTVTITVGATDDLPASTTSL